MIRFRLCFASFARLFISFCSSQLYGTWVCAVSSTLINSSYICDISILKNFTWYWYIGMSLGQCNLLYQNFWHLFLTITLATYIMVDIYSSTQYIVNNFISDACTFAWVPRDHAPALRKGTDAFCHPHILPTWLDISMFFVLKDDFWCIQWNVFVSRTIRLLVVDHSALVWKHKATIVAVTVTVALCVRERMPWISK